MSSNNSDFICLKIDELIENLEEMGRQESHSRLHALETENKALRLRIQEEIEGFMHIYNLLQDAKYTIEAMKGMLNNFNIGLEKADYSLYRFFGLNLD